METYVIVTAHGKGGVGKTTTAINTACSLQQEYEVNVIDLDNLQQFSQFNDRREEQQRFTMLKPKDDKDVRKIIENSKADIIMVDLGGYDSALGRMVLLLADLVITPLNDSDNEQNGLLEFGKTMQSIRNVRDDLRSTILVNRVHHADKSTHKAFSSFAERGSTFDVFKTVIRTRAEHKRILSTGKSVCEMAQFSTPCQEITSLVNEIKERIDE